MSYFAADVGLDRSDGNDGCSSLFPPFVPFPSIGLDFPEAVPAPPIPFSFPCPAVATPNAALPPLLAPPPLASPARFKEFTVFGGAEGDRWAAAFAAACRLGLLTERDAGDDAGLRAGREAVDGPRGGTVPPDDPFPRPPTRSVFSLTPPRARGRTTGAALDLFPPAPCSPALPEANFVPATPLFAVPPLPVVVVVPAFWAVFSTAAVAPDASSTFGAAGATAAPLSGALFGGTPFGGMPFGGTPFGGTPLDGTPLDGTPFGGTVLLLFMPPPEEELLTVCCWVPLLGALPPFGIACFEAAVFEAAFLVAIRTGLIGLGDGGFAGGGFCCGGTAARLSGGGGATLDGGSAFGKTCVTFGGAFGNAFGGAFGCSLPPLFLKTFGAVCLPSLSATLPRLLGSSLSVSLPTRPRGLGFLFAGPALRAPCRGVPASRVLGGLEGFAESRTDSSLSESSEALSLSVLSSCRGSTTRDWSMGCLRKKKTPKRVCTFVVERKPKRGRPADRRPGKAAAMLQMGCYYSGGSIVARSHSGCMTTHPSPFTPGGGRVNANVLPGISYHNCCPPFQPADAHEKPETKTPVRLIQKKNAKRPNIRRQKERGDAPEQQDVQFSRAVDHAIISCHTGGSLVYELPDDFFHLALVGINQVQQDLAKGAAHALEVPLVEVHALKLALRMDFYKQNQKRCYYNIHPRVAQK